MSKVVGSFLVLWKPMDSHVLVSIKLGGFKKIFFLLWFRKRNKFLSLSNMQCNINWNKSFHEQCLSLIWAMCFVFSFLPSPCFLFLCSSLSFSPFLFLTESWLYPFSQQLRKYCIKVHKTSSFLKSWSSCSWVCHIFQELRLLPGTLIWSPVLINLFRKTTLVLY